MPAALISTVYVVRWVSPVQESSAWVALVAWALKPAGSSGRTSSHTTALLLAKLTGATPVSPPPALATHRKRAPYVASVTSTR